MNLIYFDNNQLMDFFWGDKDYNHAYNAITQNTDSAIWTGLKEDNNLKVIRGSIKAIDQSVIDVNNVNSVWVRGKMPKSLYKFLKKHDVYVFNDLEIQKIADNKNETYKYLSGLMPHQFNSFEELKKTNLEEKDELIIKPFDGLKGQGIEIVHWEKVKKEHFEKNVIQKVIKPSKESNLFKNIFGKIKNDNYDIRMVIVDSDIAFLTLRESNSRICNAALGASLVYVPISNISSTDFKELEIFKNIVLEKLPKKFANSIFSIDFCLDENGNFYIFELNSYPGIRIQYERYIDLIIQKINSLNEKKNKRSRRSGINNNQTRDFENLFDRTYRGVAPNATNNLENTQNEVPIGISDQELEQTNNPQRFDRSFLKTNGNNAAIGDFRNLIQNQVVVPVMANSKRMLKYLILSFKSNLVPFYNYPSHINVNNENANSLKRKIKYFLNNVYGYLFTSIANPNEYDRSLLNITTDIKREYFSLSGINEVVRFQKMHFTSVMPFYFCKSLLKHINAFHSDELISIQYIRNLNEGQNCYFQDYFSEIHYGQISINFKELFIIVNSLFLRNEINVENATSEIKRIFWELSENVGLLLSLSFLNAIILDIYIKYFQEDQDNFEEILLNFYNNGLFDDFYNDRPNENSLSISLNYDPDEGSLKITECFALFCKNQKINILDNESKIIEQYVLKNSKIDKQAENYDQEDINAIEGFRNDFTTELGLVFISNAPGTNLYNLLIHSLNDLETFIE